MEPYYQDELATIYHGDCREVLPRLSGVRASLALTDPPYNIGANYSGKVADSKDGYWEWFKGIVDLCRERAEIVIFTHKVKALRYITDWDWVGVWSKPYSSGTRVGNSNIVPHYEPIFMYGIHKLGVHGQYTSDVFTYNPKGAGQVNGWHGRDVAKLSVGGHRFTKPPELFSSLISLYCGSLVLDPFLGSGTTCFCAKKLGKRSIGIDIEERYCEMAALVCCQTSVGDNEA